MYTLSVLALAATALAVPHWPVRSTFSVPSVTETFVLPPPPVETGTIWAEETEKRSANEEAQRLAEEVAAEKRGTLDSWGTSPNSSQVQITGMTYAGTGCPANSAAYALVNIASLPSVLSMLMSYTVIRPNHYDRAHERLRRLHRRRCCHHREPQELPAQSPAALP